MSSDAKHADHGPTFGGKVAMFGFGAILVVIALYGFDNWLNNRHFFHGLNSSAAPSGYQGLTTNSGTGYVRGAPVTPQECRERGGSVVNSGRSCSGYR